MPGDRAEGGQRGGPMEKEPGKMVAFCAPAGKGAAASASEESDGGDGSLPGLQGFKCLIPKVFSMCSPLPH